MLRFFTMKDILFYITESYGDNPDAIYKIVDGVAELVFNMDEEVGEGNNMNFSSTSGGPWIGGNVLYMDVDIYNNTTYESSYGLIKFTV